MTFYLKPPEGSIPSYKFEKFAETRLKYLLVILNNPNENLSDIIKKNFTTSSQLDCVIEGTAKDRVSHFALRTAVMSDFSMHRTILNGERMLFEKRLQQMTSKNLEQSVKQLVKHLKDFIPFYKISFQMNFYNDFVDITYGILIKILSKKLLRCKDENWSIDNYNELSLCRNHGDSYVIQVPFTHAIELVAKRQIHLSNGFAKLTCSELPKYLSIIFTKILECSSNTMRKSMVLRKCFEEDTRFKEISSGLKRIFQSSSIIFDSAHGTSIGSTWKTSTGLLPFNNIITLDSLDYEVTQYFPPCMRNYYTTLRNEHRLPHSARFQFTLFLKDIGLPVEDCIRMLKHEYSKSNCDSRGSPTASACSSPSSPGKCTHSWEKDSHRYIYGTKHIYGLVGARKNYSSHSCQSIIQNTLSGSCSGCPFVDCHQNTVFHKNLETDLTSLTLLNNFVPEFLCGLKNETNIPPIESCHIYLNLKKQKLLSSKSSTIGCNSKNSNSNNDSSITNLTSFNDRFSQPSNFYLKLKTSNV